MHIGIRTAQDYQKHLGQKLNRHSRAELMLFAVSSGLVPLNVQYHTDEV